MVSYLYVEYDENEGSIELKPADLLCVVPKNNIGLLH